MNWKLRLRLIFFPKSTLESAFHWGKIYGSTQTMMDHGVLKHGPEKQKEILEGMNFETRYPNC
jgi:hypothetical protein